MIRNEEPVMKIALYQMKMSQSMQENQAKCLDAIGKAAKEGADLILFPEIMYCPFFPQYEKADVSGYLLEADHPYIRQIQQSCATYHIMAAPNIFLAENAKTYDATFLIDRDGSILGLQKMVHIAQAEGFYEQDYYTPSEEGFAVFETALGKIGIVVCFDRHYPESIRTEALRGTDLILIPTANTTAEPSDLFEWEIRVQAFQNSVAIAMCNRTGPEDGMDFSGESIVTDYNGDTLALADDREQILYAEVDLDAARLARARKPYTSLRRPELYV